MTEFFTMLFIGGFIAACVVFATFVALTLLAGILGGIIGYIFKS